MGIGTGTGTWASRGTKTAIVRGESMMMQYRGWKNGTAVSLPVVLFGVVLFSNVPRFLFACLLSHHSGAMHGAVDFRSFYVGVGLVWAPRASHVKSCPVDSMWHVVMWVDVSTSRAIVQPFHAAPFCPVFLVATVYGKESTVRP